MSQLLTDARLAVRCMRKRPSHALLLVLTLAVGLAANEVIFNVLDVLVIRPFDFPNLSRLVAVWETHPDSNEFDRGNVASANFLDWREQGKNVFADLVAMEYWEVNLRGQGLSERVPGCRVSPSFFDALGVRPVAGRGFLAQEGQAGRNRLAVLAHSLWQRRFGGQAGIVGRPITIDGEPYVVVGIAPPGFRFPEGAELWSPLALPSPDTASRVDHHLSVLGVLARGRSRADAQAVLGVLARRLAQDHPKTNGNRGAFVSNFSLGFGDPSVPSLLFLWQAGALLVLLLACVNVANLILAGGGERRRELALRLALGGGRWRIVTQLLTEGVVSSIVAVVLSLPIVALATRALRDNMPAEIERFIPGWSRLGLDYRTLFFGIVLAILATAAFSTIPALRMSRLELSETLRDGGRALTAGAGRQRGRDVLVVLQIAAALVLVTCAGLAVKGAGRFLRGPQGYDPEGVLALKVSLSESRYADEQKRRDFVREAEARLAELPGVQEVGVTSALPGSASDGTLGVEIEGEPLPEKEEPPRVPARFVSESYFDALRLPLVAGRGFNAGDGPGAPPVAVVSRSMADRFWPGRDPLGRRFRGVAGEAPWVTVVGVSGDVVDQWAVRRNTPMFYRPLLQNPRYDLAFALRTTGDPDSLVTLAQRTMTALDPDQPAHSVRSMRAAISQATIGLQYVAAVLAAFGVLALVLAVSGVYGVMSYRASLRTLEIGIRVALGASRLDVLRLTLSQALRLAGVGLAVGLGLAIAAARGLSAIVQGAIVSDGPVLVILTAALGFAALVAALVPALRTLAVDPIRALRGE
jgi:putative ABC transport system permease protein